MNKTFNFQNCRVRFAPSPTGYLHIGGARTALFNWLLAKKYNGAFILRIEDTDQERYVDGSVQQIIDSLKWLGIEWSEGPDIGGEHGPYFQSQRLDIYKKHAEQLIQQGDAYFCFCTPERLEQMRNAQKEKGLVTQYDRKCRNLTDEQIQNYLKQNLPFVIRMKTPLTGSISFYDLIREEVTIPFANVDDQILLKSDGFPTYHLANVVDDHFMKITAVIRGEEWLMSTPKHLLLYNFFKWTPPQFAHLPLLLNPDRSKLSKRQGDVAVSDYKNNGFLPEAVLNFIALLGWNPGDDREILSKSELIELFDISKCGKSGSVFDIAKLKWMNGYYIRHFEKTDQQKLINYYKNYLISNNFIDENYPIEKLKLIIKLTSEKIETINDLNKFIDLLFNENFNYESDAEREISKSENFKKLKSALFESLEKIEELTDKNLMTFIKDIQNQTGIKGKELYKLLRILISGHSEGPDLATLFLFFNKSGIVNRLKNLK